MTHLFSFFRRFLGRSRSLPTVDSDDTIMRVVRINEYMALPVILPAELDALGE